MSDMEELRSILLNLQLKLKSIVNRIPDGMSLKGSPPDPATYKYCGFPDKTPSRETRLPGEGPMSCAEQYHSSVLISFHRWARVLLSLFIDKVMSPS